MGFYILDGHSANTYFILLLCRLRNESAAYDIGLFYMHK